MQKTEILQVFRKLKAHYQNIDTEDYIINEWFRIMQPYDIEDVLRKIDEHLKGENAVYIPKPHYLIKYLKTIEEKEKQSDIDKMYTVQCNLCNKWMSISKHDEHYDKCLDIEYLVGIASEKKENITRKDLEEYEPSTIRKLLDKYKVEEV